MRYLPLLLLVACGSDDVCRDRPVSWAYIHAAIIVPNCATSGCHAALTQAGGGFLLNSPINLQDRERAYDTLRGISGAIDLLRRGALKGPNDTGTDDYRMPPDQPLPNADIDLIQCWVDSGYPR